MAPVKTPAVRHDTACSPATWPWEQYVSCYDHSRAQIFQSTVTPTICRNATFDVATTTSTLAIWSRHAEISRDLSRCAPILVDTIMSHELLNLRQHYHRVDCLIGSPAFSIRTCVLLRLSRPIAWLIFNIIFSELFLMAIVSIIGVRVVRRITRYANLRVVLHDSLARPGSHQSREQKFLLVQEKKRNAWILQQELETEMLQDREGNWGLYPCGLHQTFAKDEGSLKEAVVLPPRSNPLRTQASLFAMLADTLMVHPRHVVKDTPAMLATTGREIAEDRCQMEDRGGMYFDD